MPKSHNRDRFASLPPGFRGQRSIATMFPQQAHQLMFGGYMNAPSQQQHQMLMMQQQFPQPGLGGNPVAGATMQVPPPHPLQGGQFMAMAGSPASGDAVLQSPMSGCQPQHVQPPPPQANVNGNEGQLPTATETSRRACADTTKISTSYRWFGCVHRPKHGPRQTLPRKFKSNALIFHDSSYNLLRLSHLSDEDVDLLCYLHFNITGVVKMADLQVKAGGELTTLLDAEGSRIKRSQPMRF